MCICDTDIMHTFTYWSIYTHAYVYWNTRKIYIYILSHSVLLLDNFFSLFSRLFAPLVNLISSDPYNSIMTFTRPLSMVWNVLLSNLLKNKYDVKDMNFNRIDEVSKPGSIFSYLHDPEVSNPILGFHIRKTVKFFALLL